MPQTRIHDSSGSITGAALQVAARPENEGRLTR